ncbi:MAG TPA: hypothetical protein QGF35_02220 [Dehalococcoidia bacterium]|nr:hypothetical protein [Dehalococcoidia bacterium]
MARLKAREFLFQAEDRAITLLGEVTPPERRVMWTTLQYHYGEPWIHYELQPHVGRQMVEIGLHFEGAAEQNERAASLVAHHAGTLLASLGPNWELEEWTNSWRRLHRTLRFKFLNPDLAEEAAEAFAVLVTETSPILSTSDLLSEPSATVRSSAPFRRRQRGGRQPGPRR